MVFTLICYWCPKVSVFSTKFPWSFAEIRNSHGAGNTNRADTWEKYIVGHWVDFQAQGIKNANKRLVINTWWNIKYQLSDLNHVSHLNINRQDNNKNKHKRWLKSGQIYIKEHVFATFVKHGSTSTLIKLTAMNINTNGPLQSCAVETGFVIDPNPLISVAWMNSRTGLPWCLYFNSIHCLLCFLQHQC